MRTSVSKNRSSRLHRDSAITLPQWGIRDMCRHLGHALSNSSEYGAPVHWFSIKVIDWMIGLTNRTDLRLQCRGCYGHAIIYASIWKHMRISSSTLICFSLSLSLTPGLFLFFYLCHFVQRYSRDHISPNDVFLTVLCFLSFFVISRSPRFVARNMLYFY